MKRKYETRPAGRWACWKPAALALAIATGWAAQAQAQDRWQGTYGGLTFGAAGEAVELGQTNGETRHETDNAKLGAFVGFNRTRAESNFVWGAETHLTTLGNNKVEGSGTLGRSKFHRGALLDTRLRVGLATEKTFFYGIVGIALTNAKVLPDGSNENLVNGALSLGLGAEFALNEQWSTRVDLTATGLGGYEKSFNGTSREVQIGTGQISVGVSRKF